MSASTIERVKDTLAEKARALQSGFTLYYAGDEPFEFRSNGLFFTIPAEGNLVVKDIYGVDLGPRSTAEERAQARKIVTSGLRGRPVKGNRVIMSAMSVVEFAIEKFSERGVCLLVGNEKDDADSIKEARAKWASWRTVSAETILRSYERRTENFYHDARHAGQPAPPMGDHERKAQEFLDDQKAGNKGRRAFLCPANCGYDADSEERINTHIAAKHPMLADKVEAVATPGRKKAS
jgi:hypothetical protein